MRKILSLVLICFLIVGCRSSAEIITHKTIPPKKTTIFLSFEKKQISVSYMGYVSTNITGAGNGATEITSFDTLNNRQIVKKELAAKGFKVTNKIKNADLILFGGCESSQVESIVTLVLTDAKTEEEYLTLTGTYGMGNDAKGDIKGALENALKKLPF